MTAHPILAAVQPVVDHGVGRLLRDGVPLRSPEAVRSVLRQVATEAYQRGRDDAIRELHTVAQAAAALGVSDRRVRTLAASRAIGWRVGREILFRPEDIDRMRVRRPGSPGHRRNAEEVML